MSTFLKKVQSSASNNPLPILLAAIFFFVFAAVFLPLVGSFFLFLLPMILFLNATVNGPVKTSTVFFFSYLLLLILAVLLKMEVPYISVFAMGASGFFLAQIAAKNYSIEKTIIYPALLIIGAISFYFIYDALALGVHPWRLVEKFIRGSVAESIEFYGRMPVKAEDVQVIKDNEKNIVTGFVQIFPSMVVILSVFVIWGNFLIGRNHLMKAGIAYPKLLLLARWKAPEKIIWIFLGSGILLFVGQKYIDFLSLNVFLVICFIYLLQGLAIVSFLFQIKRVPFFFRYLFYFLIAVQQFLMIPIIAIGLFDIWVDFRKLFQKNQTAD